MDFFDCNVFYGAPPVPNHRIARTADELVDEMDWIGISEALVTNATQRYDDPIAGNEQVLHDCAGSERLHPTWVLLPHQTGEFPPPDQLPKALSQARVKALWAFPSGNKYLLDANTFGPTFEVLSWLQVPLFLSLNESSGSLSGWSLVCALLANFPDLTLVAADQSCWGQDRYFRPLVEKYPRFYFDVSDYELAGGYESFCNAYGPDRMLFATGFPQTNMGGAVLTLLHASIKLEWKEAIAAGNLRRLLTEVRL